MDVIKQFEELADIEYAMDVLKDVAIVPVKAFVFCVVLCVVTVLTMLGAFFISPLFAFVALVSIFGLLICLDLSNITEKEKTVFSVSFSDLKEKLAQETGFEQNFIESFLNNEQYARHPVAYSLALENLEPFKNRAQELKNDLLGDFDDISRQKIKTIASYLDKENRKTADFKFQTFKQLVEEFNEEVEAKGLDEDTQKALNKAGVHSYKKDVKKIEIEE